MTTLLTVFLATLVSPAAHAWCDAVWHTPRIPGEYLERCQVTEEPGTSFNRETNEYSESTCKNHFFNARGPNFQEFSFPFERVAGMEVKFIYQTSWVTDARDNQRRPFYGPKLAIEDASNGYSTQVIADFINEGAVYEEGYDKIPDNTLQAWLTRPNNDRVRVHCHAILSDRIQQ